MGLKNIIMRALAFTPTTWQNTARRRYRASRDLVRLWLAGCRDSLWYGRHSGLVDYQGRGALQARIIKTYHGIEKGLALPAPRPGFGQEATARLIEDCNTFLARFGPDRSLLAAAETLGEYVQFNANAEVDLPEVRNAVVELREAMREHQDANCLGGGTLEVTREAIHKAGRLDLQAFFQSRYSVRQFSPETVDPSLIEAAVRMAQKTPSVCNREAGGVYVVHDKPKASTLLQYQNGNRGFGDQADKLIVIATRLDCFNTVGERNQCWIDGGLFAMSLIYALHSLGLGTCCLNWSVEPTVDRAFKVAAGIPEDQAIIMLLAVGHLPERFRVAKSMRRPIEDVLIHI